MKSHDSEGKEWVLWDPEGAWRPDNSGGRKSSRDRVLEAWVGPHVFESPGRAHVAKDL